MTSAESVGTSGAPEPGPRSYTVRPAAGIYGLIVAASVITVVGTHMDTLPLAVAVVGTLIVYWVAEEYAALVEHAGAGHMPTWAHIRGAMRAKWPIVSASYIPLVTLLAGAAVRRDAVDGGLHRAVRHRGAADGVRLAGRPILWSARLSAGRDDADRGRTRGADDLAQGCPQPVALTAAAPRRDVMLGGGCPRRSTVRAARVR